MVACAAAKYGLVKSADSVLVLGSSLEPVVKNLDFVTNVAWMKEDGSRRVIDESKQIRKNKGQTVEGKLFSLPTDQD